MMDDASSRGAVATRARDAGGDARAWIYVTRARARGISREVAREVERARWMMGRDGAMKALGTFET
jgi:hypothetical protein